MLNRLKPYTILSLLQIHFLLDLLVAIIFFEIGFPPPGQTCKLVNMSEIKNRIRHWSYFRQRP